jgi:hypothetical protein
VNRLEAEDTITIYTNTVIPVDFDVAVRHYTDVINPTAWDLLDRNPQKILHAWLGLTRKSKVNTDGLYAVIPFRLHKVKRFLTDRRLEQRPLSTDS